MLSDWQRIYLRTALVSDFVRLGVVISVDRMGRNISAALHPLNGMPKNTPANREKYRGVLWVGLQTMAIRPRFQPESKLFPGKPGSCKTSGGFLAIFGGFQRFKKLRKAVIFFRIGWNFWRKRPESTDSRIGRNARLAPVTPKKSCADWTTFLRFSLISRTRNPPRKRMNGDGFLQGCRGARGKICSRIGVFAGV